MAAAEDGLAHPYVDTAHRAALLYSFATLLIADLGRPERFLNMLRVFKPTSPLNIGSWVLSAFVPAARGSALLDRLGWFPRLQRTAVACWP